MTRKRIRTRTVVRTACSHGQPIGHVPAGQVGPTACCQCCRSLFGHTDGAKPIDRQWCPACRPQLLKLDLACGQRKREGFTGIDKVALPTVDIVHDLLVFPWPLKDESTEEIWVSHWIEHIPMAEDAQGVDLLIRVMDEIHRVLVVGGTCTVTAPWWASVRAWQDPTHRRAISDATFLYFNAQWRKDNALDHYPIRADFDFRPTYNVEVTLGQRNLETQAFWMRYYVNAIQDVVVTLTKKGVEPPVVPTKAPPPG